MRRLLHTLRSVLLPEGDLATRSVRSGAWELGLNLGTRGLELVVLVVLARLLTPADFGLIGIALLTFGGVNRLTRLGLDEALIYNADEDVDRYLDTAWTLSVVRGCALGAFIFLVAPVVAGVFGEPRAADVIRGIALVPVITGLRNPAALYFVKELQFHRQFVYRFSGSFVDFGVALAFALAFRSVWALVFGYLAGEATRLLASYLLHSYRPGLRPDRALATEMLGYGKWITANNGLAFLLGKGDDVFVGWYLSATALGLYQVAFRTASAPATEVTKTISNVLFSTYAKLQGDDAALRRTFVRTMQLVSVVSFPMAVGIVVVAPAFIEGVLGPQWLPATGAMQLLAVYGLLVSLTAAFHQIWKALGRPDYVTRVGTVRLVALALVIVPATAAFGITGTAAAVAGVYVFVALPVDLFLMHRLIGVGPRRLAAEVAVPFTASVGMAATTLLVRASVAGVPAVVELVLLVAVGGASYAVLLVGLDRRFSWGLRGNLRVVSGAFGRSG
ncbi:lipopolysaccharide biosynthesis protein [Salinigranum halophilum]|uniref:lipopolysaccharide biosynthesis protein n=1 Tax=Salinigranum halophilum TaxID=2565931 RepID=UPI0010A7526D|nr:lipopolysaccharide biosynthesis protein [Salinigranum halophilum]